ncbi:hypothetical protein CMV_014687 [Castanea mollissima]|uniref:Uncharacterized protein n=1 Tax=Castanea mollissima TaxID=60419 RepID=A0A8J4RAW8_9ROSI|nr:hypothetical protein CMV_014687 [Castanea mollissima]
MITPEALESVKAALASSEIEHKVETKKKIAPHKVAGQAWEDPTLAAWPKSTNYFSLLLFTMCWHNYTALTLGGCDVDDRPVFLKLACFAMIYDYYATILKLSMDIFNNVHFH